MADQLYIRSSIGESLMVALETMVEDGKIPEVLAYRVKQEFSTCILKSLEQRVTAKSSFKGQLDTYRYCDNVWDFKLRDVTFRLSPTQSSNKKDDVELKADRIQLVLVDSKVIAVAAGN